MKYYTAVNGIIYSIGWLFCVLCGANHITFWPLLFTGVAVIGQLLYLRTQTKQKYYLDLLTLIYGASFGLLMEISFLSLGLLSYATDNILSSLLPPGWIWSLYFLFSMTLNHTFKFLKKSQWLALIFGAFGGPISYLVGARLGAVTLLFNTTTLWLGVFWGVYFLLIFYIIQSLEKLVTHFVNQESLNTPLTVFYDSICPICSKEIDYLKKRKKTGKVHFFDLASREEFENAFNQINYLSAMKEIHAIDPNGNVIKGVDVFSELYARRDLIFISLLMKAPVMHSIFNFGYSVWARYRFNNRCKISPIEK